MLFSNRNIAALAAAVGGLTAQISVALSLTAGYDKAEVIRPLSSNQQQMWWLRELAGATVYNVPTAISVSGELDPQLLQQALGFVAGRHEVLRMRYKDLGDGLVGVVDAPDSAFLPLVCRRVQGGSEAVAALQKAVGTAFELAEGPPVCAYLLSSSPSTHVLGIVMHHIAGDGWSVGLLWKELSAAYTALAAGTWPQLPPLPLQYPDYAVWQHKVLFQYFEHSASNVELQWGSEAHSTQFPGRLKRETAQLDLTIEIEEHTIHTYYSAELFDASTVKRMMDSYMQLLQQLAQAPDTQVGAASVLQEQVEQQLLGWGAGEERVDQLQAPLAHEAFLAVAGASPDSCCLAFEGSSLSYRAVQQRAAALAQQLQAAGVGPGVAVGVLLERSLELPIAVLAVLMAGGCYVPLDPSYPEQRLQGYLQDAGGAALLTSSKLENMSAAVAGASGVQVFLADKDGAADGQHQRLASVPRDSAAYIIFTSGST
eukprot:gene14876-15076_t